MGNIWRMRRPLKVIDLNLNWSLANAYAADPESKMIPKTRTGGACSV